MVASNNEENIPKHSSNFSIFLQKTLKNNVKLLLPQTIANLPIFHLLNTIIKLLLPSSMESSPNLHKKVNLPLTPIINKHRKTCRQTQFVLDCTNPSQSRMNQYAPQQDPYIQPYISVLLSKVQNVTSSSLDFKFKIRKTTVQAVTSQDFKNFLSSKINAIKNKPTNALDQNRRELNALSSGKRVTKHKDKQTQFMQNKFRCFLQNKGSHKKKQNS